LTKCGYLLEEILLRKKLFFLLFGIDEEGYRKILNFEVNPSKGTESWLEIIKRPYDRFVTDGIIGPKK